MVPSFLSNPSFTLKLIPQNKWRVGWGFGELYRMNIFCCWAKTKEGMDPVGCVTIDLLWHFCTNYILKWQSSIRRFSHTNRICMSKKIKYPFIYFLLPWRNLMVFLIFFPLILAIKHEVVMVVMNDMNPNPKKTPKSIWTLCTLR